ncbi:glycoside hydrolase family 18 protein [Piedraia hortae CBS 480.64]|uniref:Glycoside hydrolase family 18 protein n=1 Tax=Piedraia hortae CBS 480.64 TaxID=1314780 RepID=A0A6A7BTP4_9PEZI|nr:glycoside hydrolase family 18 protein [Piedraia hortae CBS 480.64]
MRMHTFAFSAAYLLLIPSSLALPHVYRHLEKHRNIQRQATPAISGTPSASAVSTFDYEYVNGLEHEFYRLSPKISALSTSLAGSLQHTSTTSLPQTTLIVTPTTSSLINAFPSTMGPIAPGAATSTPTSTSANGEQPTGSYTFNASSNQNLDVYYDASSATKSDGLLTLCENPNVGIVVLAFLNQFVAEMGYPRLELGNACNAPNAAQRVQAPGLRGSIRPFESISLDGFDLNNESKDTTGYVTLATRLRSLFDRDSNKTYCLSCAPQFPIPDLSIPLQVLKLSDFVWVQFYDNPMCNLGTSSFVSQASARSNLSRNNSDLGRPKL